MQTWTSPPSSTWHCTRTLIRALFISGRMLLLLGRVVIPRSQLIMKRRTQYTRKFIQILSSKCNCWPLMSTWHHLCIYSFLPVSVDRTQQTRFNLIQLETKNQSIDYKINRRRWTSNILLPTQTRHSLTVIQTDIPRGINWEIKKISIFSGAKQ